MAKRMTSQEKKAEKLIQHRVQRAAVGLQIPLTHIVEFDKRARGWIACGLDDAALASKMWAFVMGEGQGQGPWPTPRSMVQADEYLRTHTLTEPKI